MNRYGEDARKTPEWGEAEQRYSQYHTHDVFSIMGINPILGITPEELDRELEAILEVCPDYFPVWFHRAEYRLRIGEGSEGERFFDKAFNHMVNILQDEGEFKQALCHRVGSLEKLLRYDLAVKYLEKAVRFFPDTAAFYDDLAFYILQLPDRHNADALRWQLKALELDPDNDRFLNNLGWVHLMMGNYKDAEDLFQKASEFNPGNSIALKNLETAEFMDKKRLNYFQYLVQPADMNELSELLEMGDFEDAAALGREYNADKVDAFKIHHLDKKTLPPHEILNVLQPFGIFMETVARIEYEGSDEDEIQIFLYEDIDRFHKRFKYLLYQFIFLSEYVEEWLLDDICHSLTVFYDFLREVNRVTPDQYRRFIEHVKPLIADFSHKLAEYNHIRHDVTLDGEERKRKIIHLFGVYDIYREA
jgi:tetratricopeptide (TPR) repeat protein